MFNENLENGEDYEQIYDLYLFIGIDLPVRSG